MAKHLKIIVMIFALGMFIVPNQMLFAQNTETACCTKEKSEKDCCSSSKKSSPCHDTSKKSQSCKFCPSEIQSVAINNSMESLMCGYNCSLSFDKGEKQVKIAFKSAGTFFEVHNFLDPVIIAECILCLLL